MNIFSLNIASNSFFNKAEKIEFCEAEAQKTLKELFLKALGMNYKHFTSKFFNSIFLVRIIDEMLLKKNHINNKIR